MPIEAALIKPVVDALMGLFRQGHDLQLKHNAEAALREAIRELLLANPDENKTAARIAIAKAAAILSEDVVLAEDMLRKHRDNKGRTHGKSSGGRPRKSVVSDDKPTADTKSMAGVEKLSEKPPDKPKVFAKKPTASKPPKR
jgi:hypothetical protein